MSAASTSSQKAGTSMIDALPELKRGRGRPRKNRDNLEDGKQTDVKHRSQISSDIM